MFMSRLAAAAALLCSTGLAGAAPFVPMATVLNTRAYDFVLLGTNLGNEGDFDTSTYKLFLPSLSYGSTAKLDWTKEVDHLPNGGGGERSTGLVQVDSTGGHAATFPVNGPLSVSMEGRVASTALWSKVDDQLNELPAHVDMSGSVDVQIIMSLGEPLAVRLSGQLDLPGSGDDWNANLLIRDFQEVTPLASWNIDNGTQSFEAQWVLPPGDYLLYSEVVYHEFGLPCCNIAYGGSGGWAFTLEFDSPAPVPEPASLGLLLAGPAVLRLRTRQPV